MNDPLIKIYGERNTGTNYLAQLIDLNLHAAELPGVLPPRIRRLKKFLPEEFVLDLYFDITGRRNLGWKHAVAPQPGALERRFEEINFITLTKNPYSWLLSLHKRPYHHPASLSLDFETFVKSSWRTVRRERAPRILDSPVALWNIKNASYLSLKRSRFPTMNVTFEDLLDSPGHVIQRLQSEFQCSPKRSEFRNVERSAKGHDKDADFYRDYYLKEKWRHNLSAESIRQINRRLDPELVRQFGYQLLD